MKILYELILFDSNRQRNKLLYCIDVPMYVYSFYYFFDIHKKTH